MIFGIDNKGELTCYGIYGSFHYFSHSLRMRAERDFDELSPRCASCFFPDLPNGSSSRFCFSECLLQPWWAFSFYSLGGLIFATSFFPCCSRKSAMPIHCKRTLIKTDPFCSLAVIYWVPKRYFPVASLFTGTSSCASLMCFANCSSNCSDLRGL